MKFVDQTVFIYIYELGLLEGIRVLNEAQGHLGMGGRKGMCSSDIYWAEK